jgi:hypothetical protein
MSKSVVFLLPGFSDVEKMAEKAIRRQKRSHPESSGCVIQAQQMGAVGLFRIIKTAPRKGKKKDCQQERTA